MFISRSGGACCRAGGELTSSFRRRPESNFPLVIPAKAGIHSHLSSRRKPESTPTCHPGESRDPFAVALIFDGYAKTDSRPCVFHSHPASGSLSLACPRESNPREGQPGWDAGCAGSLRSAGVPLTGHPVLLRNERDPSRSPALMRGPGPSALRRPTRAPRSKDEAKARSWIPAFAGMTACGLRNDGRFFLASAARRPLLRTGGPLLCSSGSPSVAVRTRRKSP